MVKQGTACQGMCRNLRDGNLKNQVRPLLFGGCLERNHPAPAWGLAWSLALLLSSLFLWLCPTARLGKHICNAAERLFCKIGGPYPILSMQYTFLVGVKTWTENDVCLPYSTVLIHLLLKLLLTEFFIINLQCFIFLTFLNINKPKS